MSKFTPDLLKELSAQVADYAIKLAENNYFVARILASNARTYINEEEKLNGEPNSYRSFVRPTQSDRALVLAELERSTNLSGRPEPAKQNSDGGARVLDSGDAKKTFGKCGERDTGETSRTDNKSRGKKRKLEK
jgi:hypothetical protein